MKDLFTSRLVLIGSLVFVVLMVIGSTFYLLRVENERRVAEKRDADSVRRWNENTTSSPSETPPAPSTAETTQSSSEQSVQRPVDTPIQVSDPDMTHNDSPQIPEAEAKVVPEQIVQEANRFRKWKKKNDALAERRRTHWKKSNDLHQQANRFFVDFLMLRPIEKRRKAIEDIKQHLFELGVSDTYVTAMEQELYALGLDFVTAAPAEVAAVRAQEMIKAINAHGAQIREDLEISEQLMREQQELDAISKDF